MSNTNKKYGRILLAACIIPFAVVAISYGKTAGMDWYCAEPEVHAQYEKHLALHINHEAEAITKALDEIYTTPSLTLEQKHRRTLAILKKHLTSDHDGEGVGD